MNNFPESVDIFVNRTGADDIGSSDPNNAYDAIEVTQGLIGALGEPQTWSTTLMTLLRRYKRGFNVDITSGEITVRLGEVVLENTDGTKFAFRRNSSDVVLSAGNIDVGTLIATAYYIYATAKGVATTSPLMFSTDSLAPSGIGTAPYRRIGWFLNTAAGALLATFAGEYDAEPNGKVLQEVSFQSSVFSTGSTQIPYDDSKPLISEGDEYLRCAICPISPKNKIIADVLTNGDVAAASIVVVALFNTDLDATEAIGCVANYQSQDQMHPISMHYETPPGLVLPTVPTIFTVRIGGDSATTFGFNGLSSGRKYGGALISGIRLREIAS